MTGTRQLSSDDAHLLDLARKIAAAPGGDRILEDLAALEADDLVVIRHLGKLEPELVERIRAEVRP